MFKLIIIDSNLTLTNVGFSGNVNGFFFLGIDNFPIIVNVNNKNVKQQETILFFWFSMIV